MDDLTHKPIITESSSSSSSDDDDEIEDECVNTPESQPEPANNVQKYFQNVGVKILPNIPEENEEEEDINEITSKRLSRISAILQDINDNNPRNLNLSVNNLYQPDEIVEGVEKEEEDEMIEVSVKKPRCFSITSSTRFEIEARRKKLKNFLREYFVKSVFRTLKSVYFYPAILSSVVNTLLPTVVFVTAPYMMCLKNSNGNHTEATFILTIIGFSWLFFLAGHPVFSKLSTLKIKILYLFGLAMSGFSLCK